MAERVVVRRLKEKKKFGVYRKKNVLVKKEFI